MAQFRGGEFLRQGLVMLVLLPVAAACNGSDASTGASTSMSQSASGGTSAADIGSSVSSDAATASSVSSDTATASSVSSDTATASSVSSDTATASSVSSDTATASSVSSGTAYTTTLFEQPWESGIKGQLAVPKATHTAPPKGVFTLVLWQPNRFQSNGLLVPTGWNAGSRTGFTPSNAVAAQLGFQNKAGTSTAQMEGDTVGAYINSQDLPASTTDQKMMITPQFMFLVGSQPMPFSSLKSSLSGSMDLQIPTAVGRSAYVVADLLFKDQNGTRVSFGIKIFSNGATHPVVGSGYDTPSGSYMLNSPLGVDQRFVTRASDSASAAGTPWSGWRHFGWSISEAQFVSALQYLTTLYPGKVTSTDPAQYVLAEVHLNAEFHTKGLPAELGWSMRGLKLWTTP